MAQYTAQCIAYNTAQYMAHSVASVVCTYGAWELFKLSSEICDIQFVLVKLCFHFLTTIALLFQLSLKVSNVPTNTFSMSRSACSHKHIQHVKVSNVPTNTFSISRSAMFVWTHSAFPPQLYMNVDCITAQASQSLVALQPSHPCP